MCQVSHAATPTQFVVGESSVRRCHELSLVGGSDSTASSRPGIMSSQDPGSRFLVTS